MALTMALSRSLDSRHVTVKSVVADGINATNRPKRNAASIF
jgi:hypothetical protein